LGNFPKLLLDVYSYLPQIIGRRRHDGNGNDDHHGHDDDNDDSHPRERYNLKLPI